jgi:hypothetical protein
VDRDLIVTAKLRRWERGTMWGFFTSGYNIGSRLRQGYVVADWTLVGTLKLLAVYGHGDIGALEEIDRAFSANVRALRAVAAPSPGRAMR